LMSETYAARPLVATAVPGFTAALLGGLCCHSCGRVIDGGDFRVTEHEDLEDITHVEVEIICSQCHRTGAKLNISVEAVVTFVDDDGEE
jgi:hypothetical protein